MVWKLVGRLLELGAAQQPQPRQLANALRALVDMDLPDDFNPRFDEALGVFMSVVDHAQAQHVAQVSWSLAARNADVEMETMQKLA